MRIVEEKLPRSGIGFSDTARELIGPFAVPWVKAFLIMLQWGCCASYILFFMEFFEYAFYRSADVSLPHELLYLLLALVIILPMTLIDNIATFAKYNAISNVHAPRFSHAGVHGGGAGGRGGLRGSQLVGQPGTRTGLLAQRLHVALLADAGRNRALRLRGHRDHL